MGVWAGFDGECRRAGASQAVTEKAAKLEEQNLELVGMAEVQQQAYARLQITLDNECAANKLTVGGDTAKVSESAQAVDLELGRMEIEKVCVDLMHEQLTSSIHDVVQSQPFFHVIALNPTRFPQSSDSSLVRPLPALPRAAQLTKQVASISALEKEQAELLEEMETESAKLKASLAARETTISKVRRAPTRAVQIAFQPRGCSRRRDWRRAVRCRGVIG